MDRLLEQMDSIPEGALLVLNAGMGGFVLLAHGGALLMLTLMKAPAPPEFDNMVRTMTPFTIPLAALVVLGSVVAFVKAPARRAILTGQAVLLFASAVGVLGWAAQVAIQGIPDGNFSWSPGLLTGWVGYASFLCARYCVPAARRSMRVRYIPLGAAALALPVDVAVVVRLALKMHRL